MSSPSPGQPVLEAAYRNHSDYVFGVCLKFAGGDRSWALDRAHDVFIRLHDHLPKLKLDDDLRPWLRKVAVNECLLDLRRRDRRQRLLRLFGQIPETRSPRPEQELATARDVIALDGALGSLPPAQRVLLGLMYFDGESLTEAARLMGICNPRAGPQRSRFRRCGRCCPRAHARRPRRPPCATCSGSPTTVRTWIASGPARCRPASPSPACARWP